MEKYAKGFETERKFTPDQLKAIFDKIPELKPGREVFLSQVFFRNLNDEEFTTLWYMPGLIIHVADKTRAYIEKRRLKLGLQRTKHVKDIILDRPKQE